MSKTQYYKEWFDEYNKEWLVGAYDSLAYEYPVGRHRLRILLNNLGDDDLRGKKVLDIGCGGAIFPLPWLKKELMLLVLICQMVCLE